MILIPDKIFFLRQTSLKGWILEGKIIWRGEKGGNSNNVSHLKTYFGQPPPSYHFAQSVSSTQSEGQNCVLSLMTMFHNIGFIKESGGTFTPSLAIMSDRKEYFGPSLLTLICPSTQIVDHFSKNKSFWQWNMSPVLIQKNVFHLDDVGETLPYTRSVHWFLRGQEALPTHFQIPSLLSCETCIKKKQELSGGWIICQLLIRLCKHGVHIHRPGYNLIMLHFECVALGAPNF